MPRTIRVEYSGAVYPVLSRGDRWEDIDLDDMGRQDFLKTQAEDGQQPGGWCMLTV
jgi:hypothetical protein